MSSEGRVVHKQHFQNAQQIIEVTIKAKPRVKLGLKTKAKNFEPFERNCLLKDELEKVTKEIEAKRSKIKNNKMNPERPMPKLKINSPKTIIEIEKKSKKKKEKKSYNNVLLLRQPQGKNLKTFSSARLPDSEKSALYLDDFNREVAQKKIKKYSKTHENYVDENLIPEDDVNVDKLRLIDKSKHVKKRQEEKKKERSLRDTFPPEATWEDVLRACSSAKTSDSSKSSLHSEVESNARKKVKDHDKLYRNCIGKNLVLQENANHNPETYISSSKYNNKRKEQKEFDNISNSKYETNSKSSNHYRYPIILPVNAGKTLYVNKSIQTSVISTVEDPALKQPDSRQSGPKNFPMKTPSDHTHSLCSESALKILQQLHDKLYSKGDGKCSELVNALVACLSAEGKSARRNFEDAADSASPLLPEAFMQKTVTSPLMDLEKQRLEKIIDEQERKIAEDKETIQELKSLLTQFMTYLQQINDQLIEPASSARSGQNNPKERGKDCEVDISVLEDLNKAVKNLMIERDAFIRENRKLKDINFHLEVKLSQLGKAYDLRRERQNIGLDAGLTNQYQPGKDGKLVKEINSTHLRHSAPSLINSDADSAFEEKSYKSSVPSSKTSSNINRSSSAAQENKIPALIVTERSDKNSLPSVSSKRPVLSEAGVYTNRRTNHGDSLGLKRAKLPVRGVEENIIYSFDNCYQPSDHEKSSICGTHEENISEPSSKDFKGNVFSETSDYSKLGIYLESTHVNDKKKDNPSSTKYPVSRNRFEPHLSRITSEASDSETRLTSVRIESE